MQSHCFNSFTGRPLRLHPAKPRILKNTSLSQNSENQNDEGGMTAINKQVRRKITVYLAQSDSFKNSEASTVSVWNSRLSGNAIFPLLFLFFQRKGKIHRTYIAQIFQHHMNSPTIELYFTWFDKY